MFTPYSKNNNQILAKEWLYRGRKAQDSEEKLYCYSMALKINPYNIYAWNGKGNVLFSLGRFQEALGCYNKAIELDFKFSKAWGGKGNTLRKLGNPSEAIRCYDKSISFCYEDPYVWNGKGDALRDLGNYSNAIKCYDRAIKLRKDLSYPWNGKGFAFYELEFYEEAVNSFNEAIKIDPIFYYSWFGRGNALLKLEKYEEAINCYEKVLKISPEFDGITKRKEIAENNLKNKLNFPQASKVEVQQLEMFLVQSLKNLVIFCAREDNKPEVLNRLYQLKRYAGGYQKELENFMYQLEYMVKNEISLEGNFTEGLTVLLNKIEHEFEEKVCINEKR